MVSRRLNWENPQCSVQKVKRKVCVGWWESWKRQGHCFIPVSHNLHAVSQYLLSTVQGGLRVSELAHRTDFNTQSGSDGSGV